WLLTKWERAQGSGADDPWQRRKAIEGFCSHPTIRAGDTLRVYVSTDPVSAYRAEIYRMGYYGGSGGRLVRRVGPFEGMVQPTPTDEDQQLVQCRWTPGFELEIPQEWLSGVYLGQLTATATRYESFFIFIARDDRPADFLFQCSDTTWQAYNRWPSQFSLYDDGKKQWYWGPNVDISFDRPYGKYCQILDAPLSTGSGEWFLWEFPLAYWIEAQGYDVSYISNLDLHSDPRGLLRAKGFL